jgi:hypothetical protein
MKMDCKWIGLRCHTHAGKEGAVCLSHRKTGLVLGKDWRAFRCCPRKAAVSFANPWLESHKEPWILDGLVAENLITEH